MMDKMTFWEEISDLSFGMRNGKDDGRNDDLGKNTGFVIWDKKWQR